MAQAAIASMIGIELIADKEKPVKVPDTELIAHLRLGHAPSVRDQAPLAALLARNNGELSARDLWQRFGGEIDAFYEQLKSEVSQGWIQEPAPAEVRERVAERTEA